MKELFNLGIFSFFKKSSYSKEEKSNDVSVEIFDDFSSTTNINVDSEINEVYSIEYGGFYIGEFILLDWLEGKLANATPPGYFSYTYGINHNNSITKLKQMGLIRCGTPSESLAGLKVVELKNILSKNQLKVSGCKSELIDRIIATLEEVDFQNYTPPVWKQTNKGGSIASRYQILIWGHKHGSGYGAVSPATLLPYVDMERTNEVIALSLSETCFRTNFKNLDYGIASNELKYQIKLKETLELHDEAFDLLIGYAVLSFTGIHNASHSFVYFWEQDYSNPIKTYFVAYQSKLNMNSIDIIKRASVVFDIYEPNLSKIRLYKNKQEFLLALKILLDGTKSDLNTLFSQWYERAPAEYK